MQRYRQERGEPTRLRRGRVDDGPPARPFAPHLGEELHAWFGGEGSVYDAGWPRWSEAALIEETVEVVLQVNGKVRDRAVVAREADEATLRALALESARSARRVGSREVRRVVWFRGGS